MTIEKKSLRGNINISMNAIAVAAGNAATECYGVIGMASKNAIRDEIAELLKKENYSKGVFVRHTRQGIEVDMYLIVSYGVRITEVVSEVQKRVKYVLEKTFDLNFVAVNVYVQGIKNIG